MVNHAFGITACGGAHLECAPPHACLTVVYQEKTKLFTQELSGWESEECELIKEAFKQYIDYVFFLPKNLDFNLFKQFTSCN